MAPFDIKTARKLPNGAYIIAWGFHPDEVTYIVLCHQPERSQPYVVWRVDKQGACN